MVALALPEIRRLIITWSYTPAVTPDMAWPGRTWAADAKTWHAYRIADDEDTHSTESVAVLGESLDGPLGEMLGLGRVLEQARGVSTVLGLASAGSGLPSGTLALTSEHIHPRTRMRCAPATSM